MWTDYGVNVYCEALQGKWNKNLPHVLNAHRNSMFGDERFKRYGCSEPGMFSDLFLSMRFQTGYYFRKGMVVQQDFEKGRSQRLWFRRYDRYKN